MKRLFEFGMIIVSLAGHAAAQDTGAGKQDLSQAANDPTASVMSLQVADWYSFDYHNLDGGKDNTIGTKPGSLGCRSACRMPTCSGSRSG